VTAVTPVKLQTPRAFADLLRPLGSYRYRVYYGGRGSAKSWQFARALLAHALAHPVRVLCAREYQASMRDSVHRVLADQIDRLGLGAAFEVQETVIKACNGSEFLFKGLRRDIAQIKSTEGVDVCWVEEAEAVSDASWRTLIPTIRQPNSEIWVSFNPALASDPTYQRFVATKPDRAIVRHVTYADNPWFPDVLRAEAESLRRADPEAYAHVWGGEPWARSDTQVLAGKVTVQEFDPVPGDAWGHPLFGADWGFARDPSVLVRCWIRDGRLWIDYEAGGVQLDMDDTAAAFRSVPLATDYTILADSARPETISEMNRRGLRVHAAPKWDGSVKDGIAHLRSYDAIVVHPRAKRFLEESRLYRYKTDPRTDEVLPVVVDAHNHAIDATRYALARIIKRGPSAFVI
jgi:phage terminase large subunit